MGGGQLSARVLNASYGPHLQEINRACPIVSDLTFWFDRGDDFFRWPELVYDRFFYVGAFAGGHLVGYCMVGLTRAWTGRDLGWLAVLGDARVLPEHRGLGWIDVARRRWPGWCPARWRSACSSSRRATGPRTTSGAASGWRDTTCAWPAA